jgi:hypothetical protein
MCWRIDNVLANSGQSKKGITMSQFIKTKHGPYISASEIAEIKERNRKSSVIVTKKNELHIVEQESCMLAFDLNFQ